MVRFCFLVAVIRNRRSTASNIHKRTLLHLFSSRIYKLLESISSSSHKFCMLLLFWIKTECIILHKLNSSVFVHYSQSYPHLWSDRYVCRRLERRTTFWNLWVFQLKKKVKSRKSTKMLPFHISPQLFRIRVFSYIFIVVFNKNS